MRYHTRQHWLNIYQYGHAAKLVQWQVHVFKFQLLHSLLFPSLQQVSPCCPLSSYVLMTCFSVHWHTAALTQPQWHWSVRSHSISFPLPSNWLDYSLLNFLMPFNYCGDIYSSFLPFFFLLKIFFNLVKILVFSWALPMPFLWVWLASEAPTPEPLNWHWREQVTSSCSMDCLISYSKLINQKKICSVIMFTCLHVCRPRNKH